MVRVSAVGIHDDLASGQTTVALRTADHESSGGVDEILGVFIQHVRRKHGAHNVLQDVRANLLLRYIGCVLRGNYHGFDAHGRIVIVFHGDLRLAVGAQIGQCAVLANGGQTAGQLVRQRNGERHIFLRFIAGIAEHHALIARALIFIHLAIYALRDIGGLIIDADQYAAAVAVEAEFRAVIADFNHLFAHDLIDRYIGTGADFAHHQHEAGRSGAFARDVRVGILFQNRVQNRIGNLVADFIGMAFGNGFGSKQMTHGKSPL